jgi:hypothetical protein
MGDFLRKPPVFFLYRLGNLSPNAQFSIDFQPDYTGEAGIEREQILA